MKTKPLSVEEVYFLVRVGNWDEKQLQAWVHECHEYNTFDEDDWKEYDDQWCEEDEVE